MNCPPSAIVDLLNVVALPLWAANAECLATRGSQSFTISILPLLLLMLLLLLRLQLRLLLLWLLGTRSRTRRSCGFSHKHGIYPRPRI